MFFSSGKASCPSVCLDILTFPEKRDFWKSGCYVKRSQGLQDELGHHVKTKLVTHVAQLVVTKVTAVWWVLRRDPTQETRVSKRILPNPGF